MSYKLHTEKTGQQAEREMCSTWIGKQGYKNYKNGATRNACNLHYHNTLRKMCLKNGATRSRKTDTKRGTKQGNKRAQYKNI